MLNNMFRCIDCNEELTEYETEMYGCYDGMCEHCFDMQQKAYADILKDEYYNGGLEL